jgi:hypothetical protein
VSLQALLLTKSIAQLQSELGRRGSFAACLVCGSSPLSASADLLGPVSWERAIGRARQSHSDACQSIAR